MIDCNPLCRHKNRQNLSNSVTTCLLAAALSLSLLAPASAQAIIATVNGAPLTNVDLAQRMKLLQAFHRPATREAAMQSLIDDQLKLEETGKFKIKAGNAEIGQQIAREAREMNMKPEALLAALERSGVSQSHLKEHFAAGYQFYVLVEAFHKGVDASESQVRAELAKDGGKSATGTDYKLRQIIFTVRAGNFADMQGRIKVAEQLRTRFTDCASGLPLARNMENVAVQPEVTRNSLQISDALKTLLEKTPTGHLTPPERSGEGIEMVAVCSKTASNDDSAVRKAISDRLLSVQYEADVAKRLKELRSYAVIENK